jgi:hypothetical protein
MRGTATAARDLALLLLVHGSEASAALAVAVGRRTVPVRLLTVPFGLLLVAGLVVVGRLAVAVGRLAVLAADLCHVLAVAADGLPTLAARLRRLLRIEFEIAGARR